MVSLQLIFSMFSLQLFLLLLSTNVYKWRYQKYKIPLVLSEPPQGYASIALAIVWNSQCFTLSLSRKLHLFIIYYIPLRRWMKRVLIQVFCFQLGPSFLKWVCIRHSKFEVTEIVKLLIWETKFGDETGTFLDVCVCMIKPELRWEIFD